MHGRQTLRVGIITKLPILPSPDYRISDFKPGYRIATNWKLQLQIF